MDEAKLLSPTFCMGWIANFLQFLVFYFLVTTMALYAIKEFQASETMGGLASSSFVIGAVIARVFSGYIIDRVGRRRIMLLGVVATTIACALYFFADSLNLLIAVRLIHGIAYAFAGTAIMAMVQEIIPPSRRSEGTGYLALGTTVSAAIGPAMALFVLGSFDYTTLFGVVMVVSIIGLGAAIFTYLKTSDPAASAPKVPFSFSSVINPAVVPIAIFMLLVAFAYSGVISYLNAYGEERDVISGAGLFFIAYAIAMLLMRSYLGKLQDRRGDNIVVFFGLVFFALSLVLLAFSHQNWQVVVAGVLAGLGFGSLMPAAQSIAVGVVDRTQFGSAFSTLFLCVDLGFGVGPIILGVILGATGFTQMYLILAGVVVIAAIFYLATHARTPRAKQGFSSVA
ncbi:MFS transporter [Corynebacterium callunae]|uniref:MFS transporter n=1 Tax=Corynebacterium callunae TaxID=1721 RepID=UPI00398253A4